MFRMTDKPSWTLFVQHAADALIRGSLFSSATIFLSLKVNPLFLKQSGHSGQRPTQVHRNRGGEPWKEKPRAEPGAWERVAFILEAHSHAFFCQEPRPPWRTSGRAAKLTFRQELGDWSCSKDTSRHSVKSRTHGYLHTPRSSWADHCSVSQDGFLSCDPQQEPTASWMAIHTQTSTHVTHASL